MTDITHTKIEVRPSKLKCILQVEWGPESAVKLRLLHREAAWVGELSESEIKSFVTQYELELATFIENMRAAFRAPSSENYIFSMTADTFTWKRPLASGLVAKLGHVKMSKVEPIDAFELVLENSLELLSTVEENLNKFKTANESLTKERDTALTRVIEMSELKANWEKKIYGQFVVVLNAKKERIQTLEEMLDLKLYKGPQTADGKPRTGKDEAMDEDDDEDSREDPYTVDTEEDTDEDVNMEPAKESSTSTSALRRSHDLFSSFDSPDSPNPPPILPKRARASNQAASTASSSTASSSTTNATSGRNVFKNIVEDEDDEAVTAESTQDLIGQM
ncbi:uncharacterized protein LOC117643673 [Thrips palmi]|uniref:Uncharacterized protein LOC117643673 n=1 Tax=Thrips palmi TaxID=161013 RepID=A0A6P8YFR8_THRPL|nr:uncharacterized protein LOC117643673 [Thrips palmi]